MNAAATGRQSARAGRPLWVKKQTLATPPFRQSSDLRIMSAVAPIASTRAIEGDSHVHVIDIARSLSIERGAPRKHDAASENLLDPDNWSDRTDR